MKDGEVRHAQRDRRGFTLAELAVTVMVVGILAGLALPNVRYAILKADAAHIVSDAHTVQLAAYEYLYDNGSFPSFSGYGIAPPGLEPYLPDGFSFMYKGVQYAWWSFTFPTANNFWKSRNIGIFLINYQSRLDLADPMKSHTGPDAYWNPTLFYFIYPG